MAKKLQLLRNSEVFGSKTLALAGLDIKLKDLAVGEPAIASYTDDDDKVSILLGISYGDGINYQIFEGAKIGEDGNLEIPKEIQDAINNILTESKSYTDQKIESLESNDSAVSHNFVTEVSEENGIVTVKRGAITSTGSTISITDGSDGGINIEIDSFNLNQYVGKDAIEISEELEGQKEISLKLNTADKILTQDESGLLANINLTWSTSDGLKLIGKDGTEIANIPATDFIKDGMLENVELVQLSEGPETNPQGLPDGTYLKFTFNTDGGSKVIYVNLSLLSDVYTGSNGVQVSGKTISAVKDPSSEGFLEIGVSGIKVSGVQNAINEAKSTIDSYTVNSKAINTNPVLNGGDITLSGYTRSELTNEDLQISSDDTVNEAFGKLEKSIIDNEEVCSKSFDDIATAVGLNREGLIYEAPSGTKYISGATSVKDADSKLDAAIKDVSDKIDGEISKNYLLQIEAGSGISITEKAENKQTVSANVNSDDPIIEVSLEGIKTKDAAVWDCGEY